MENIQKNFTRKIDSYFYKYIKMMLSMYLFLVYLSPLVKINLNNINILISLSIFFYIIYLKKIKTTTIIISIIFIFQFFLNFLLNIKNINYIYFFQDSKYIFLLIIFLIIGTKYLKRKDIVQIKNNIFLINTIFVISITFLYKFKYNSERLFFLNDISKISNILSSSFAFYKDRVFSANFTIGYILVSLINILELENKKFKYKISIIQSIIILIYSYYFSALANFISALFYLIIYFLKKTTIKSRELLINIGLISLGVLIIYFIFVKKDITDNSINVRFNQAKYLLNEFFKYPYFGKGYGGYVSVDGNIDKFKPYLYEFDLLSLLMKLGIIGCLIYYIPLFYLIYRLKIYYKNLFYCSIFILIFLLMLVSNGGFISSSFYAYIYVLIYIYINQRKEDNI